MARAKRGRYSPSSPSWSDLPDLPLFTIIACLSPRLNLGDFQRFAAVCRSWRSVSKVYLAENAEHLRHPVLLRLQSTHAGLSCDAYCLSDRRAFFHTDVDINHHSRKNRSIISYCYNHAIVDDRHLDGRHVISAVNPLTAAEVGRFPVFLYNVKAATLSAPPSSPDCLMVIAASSPTHPLTFGWCRRSDTNWCTRRIHSLRPSTRSDTFRLIVFKGRLYALIYGCTIVSFKLHLRFRTKREFEVPNCIGYRQTCGFAASGEELYFVEWRSNGPSRIYLKGKRNWQQVYCLCDDSTLFVSNLTCVMRPPPPAQDASMTSASASSSSSSSSSDLQDVASNVRICRARKDGVLETELSGDYGGSTVRCCDKMEGNPLMEFAAWKTY